VSGTRQSRRWLKEHRDDKFVKQAAREGYRSRAAYKLAEIDERHRLFAPARVVVDLGAAPGGWSQLAAERVRQGGAVLAMDILPMEPLPGVDFVQGDFREPETLDRLVEVLAGRGVDLVLSDMAPNMTGVRAADQARAMGLAELALEFADKHLVAGGSLLVKAFHGAGYEEFLAALRARFQTTRVRKPEASRTRSAETYLVAKGHGV
jgi:23S rRNA (uridine2552-2'-O)-methyltransferase